MAITAIMLGDDIICRPTPGQVMPPLQGFQGSSAAAPTPICFMTLPPEIRQEIQGQTVSRYLHLCIEPGYLAPPRLLCLNPSAYDSIPSLLATSRVMHGEVQESISRAIEERLTLVIDCTDPEAASPSTNSITTEPDSRFIENCCHIRIRFPVGFEPRNGTNTKMYKDDKYDRIGKQDLIGMLTVNLERPITHGKAGKFYGAWKVAGYKLRAVQPPQDYNYYQIMDTGLRSTIAWIDSHVKSFALTNDPNKNAVTLRDLRNKLYGFAEYQGWAGQSRLENIDGFAWRKMNCILAAEFYQAALQNQVPKREADPEDSREAARKRSWGLHKMLRRRNSTGALAEQKPGW